MPLLNDRQYKLLVESVSDYAIYMLSPVGNIASWNIGAERLQGYGSQEILGRNFAIFYSLEDQSAGEPERALETAARVGRFVSEGWRFRKDGSRFWASVVIDPIHKGGKLFGFAKIACDVSERKLSKLALEQAIQRLTLATDSGGIGIWDWDITLDLMLWDDWMYRLYGFERDDGMKGYQLWQQHLHPDDRDATEQAVSDGLSGVKPYDTEFRIVWRDGSIHHLRGSGHVTRDATGQPLHMIGSNWDITALKEAERSRDEAEAKLFTVLENMRGYVFERAMSPDGVIHYPYISASLFRMLDLTYDPGLPVPDMLRLVSPLDRDRVEQAIRQSARDFTALDMEFRLQGRDGRELWVTNRSRIRRLEDGVIIWDGFGADISAEKRAAEQLFNLTYRDNLTGTDNRLGFETALERAAQEADQRQTQFVVFLIDIADFRAINDTLGVKHGDFIIQETAHRLQRICGFDAIVARIAGDEFAVLKLAIDKNESTILANGICTELGGPIKLDPVDRAPGYGYGIANAECQIEVNVGIASFPNDETGRSSAFYQDAATEYMKRCSIALYEAKRLGRGKFSHYSRNIDHRIRNRILLRQSLHSALLNDEFILYYQPIVDFQSGKVTAAEALVRWQHPQLGFQPPDQFIPLAEESGLIVPLGAWVLKTSMKQIRQWQTELGIGKIAVNVSAVQFSQGDFVSLVQSLLLETGATADMIELELTETTLVDCSSETLAVMRKLRGFGFTLAIDDFGTGFSSLKYLSKLPVDKLKIDQFFVRQMIEDKDEASIVRAILALGHGLNLEVVAEGVETVVQQNVLIAQGCLVGQGYLFSKPIPAKEMADFVHNSLNAARLRA
jgi:diguanylate cyclase (GGDEF)-like protein/PAS domain S-box-containing protein